MDCFGLEPVFCCVFILLLNNSDFSLHTINQLSPHITNEVPALHGCPAAALRVPLWWGLLCLSVVGIRNFNLCSLSSVVLVLILLYLPFSSRLSSTSLIVEVSTSVAFSVFGGDPPQQGVFGPSGSKAKRVFLGIPVASRCLHLSTLLRNSKIF